MLCTGRYSQMLWLHSPVLRVIIGKLCLHKVIQCCHTTHAYIFTKNNVWTKTVKSTSISKWTMYPSLTGVQWQILYT